MRRRNLIALLAVAVTVILIAFLWPEKPRIQADPRRPTWPPPGTLTDCKFPIGSQLPTLNGKDLNGLPISVSFADSKATLVIVWATWCGPCMKDLPHEIELWHRHHDHGLQVISINADSDLNAVRDAQDKYTIPFPVIADGGDDGPIQQKLGVATWPTVLLVDSRGTIVQSSPWVRTTKRYVDDSGVTITVNGLDLYLEQFFAASGPDDDLDRDGVANAQDNLVTVPNSEQKDADDDGKGDVPDHIAISWQRASEATPGIRDRVQK